MKKILPEIIKFIMPIILIVAAVNIWIDPGNILQQGLEEEMADVILSVERLGVPKKYIEYDERVFQKSYITRVKEKKDVLVFGSSRSRYIRETLFPNSSFHNHAVNAASLEDFIVLYGLYRKRGFIPAKLIIAVDHWILNSESGYSNWKTLWRDYEFAANEMELDVGQLPDEGITGYFSDTLFVKHREILSPAYFQESIKRIIRGDYKYNSAVERVAATELTKSYEVYVINSDGSFADEKVPNTVEQTRKLVETVDPGIAPLKVIDKRLSKNFERFLDVLKNDNVEVILMLIPFNPITYHKWIKNDNNGLDKATKYFKDVARRKNIKIIGSYDPSVIPAYLSEFRDWVHPHRNVLERILKNK
jgi:hypothetical protein